MSFFVSSVRGIVTALAICGYVGYVEAPAGAATDPTSLYARLGGYDAIAAVTDDFIPRLIADPKLSKFFGGVSKNSADRIRQLVVDQLCAASGGPCIYLGRDMKTSHKGLHITEDDWNSALADFKVTLDKFNVGQRERNDLGAALATLKADIVEK